MERLFVAIALPEEVKDTLGDLDEVGMAGARWSTHDQYHLTLRFIGEVDGGLARDVDDALAGIEAEAFTLGLARTGYFGDRRRVRILWAGVVDPKPVAALRRKVERALQEIGLAPERRRYHPHVTLARCRGTGPAAAEAFQIRHADYRSPAFPVDRFCLFSSRLGKQGALYRIEADYPLVAGAAAG